MNDFPNTVDMVAIIFWLVMMGICAIHYLFIREG